MGLLVVEMPEAPRNIGLQQWIEPIRQHAESRQRRHDAEKIAMRHLVFEGERWLVRI
jgi:hypothetical protein